MQYCIKCGTAISSQANFCPSCGLEITLKNSSEDFVSNPLEKMEKGVTKSLQDSAQGFIKNKSSEIGSDILKSMEQSTKNLFSDKENPVSKFDEIPLVKNQGKSETRDIQTNKNSDIKVSFWIFIYLFLNVLLTLFGYDDYGISTINIIIPLAFSLFIIIMIFFRKSYQKPFNWLVKLALLLQTGLFIWYLSPWIYYVDLEAYFSDVNSLLGSPIPILMILISIVNIIQLFKGNKN